MQDHKHIATRIRLNVVKMTNRGRSSHVASCLSIVDILTVLYSDIINVRPKTTHEPDRDRFILSKGHAGAAVYATLAEFGFIDPELLKSHYQNGSIMSGHVSHKGINGVELSTGSLGHGLGVGAGLALGAKLSSQEFKVYTLLSDGECAEGSNWEAILFASHHKLNNLIAIIDYNKLQSLDSIEKTLNIEPFRSKWEAFGWNVFEINGHDHLEIKNALELARDCPDSPTVLICHTVKGKGVSFMENSVLWHYRYPHDGEELDLAVKELSEEFHL